jgi:hypothetical protein
MAEIRTVTTLHRKRDEVRKAVRKYERCLDQARADLTHLIAAIAIFEARGCDESLPAYAGTCTGCFATARRSSFANRP